MKRVRTLHQKSCSEILQLRAESIQTDSISFESVESYNALVNQLQEKHGSTWCADRAFFSIPNGFVFSIVMPVYNEASTIADMISRVCNVDLPMELIVVDDGSTDGTTDELQKLIDEDFAPANSFGNIELRILFHDSNQGKGAALKTGFKAASGDVVGIQDADQEYNPQEFVPLISTLFTDEADVVYGSRFVRGNQTNSPGWHRFGNGLITWFSNLMSGLNVSDAETCYKLIRKTALDRLLDGLIEKRFGIELEMTAKLAKFKELRFDERPISYDKRTYAEGKKIGLKDGFRALWCILKY